MYNVNPGPVMRTVRGVIEISNDAGATWRPATAHEIDTFGKEPRMVNVDTPDCALVK